MSDLDQKIISSFESLVVRKDLVKIVKGNAIVPTYVLEYLLGQYCATSDPATIETGIETVKEILRKHYVHRNEAGLIRSTIKEKGRHKVIDKVAVDLNDKGGFYEASFTNLGIKNVQIETDYIKKHPKLLVGGVWCIVDLQYEPSDDPKQEPWHIDSLKPIQISHFDFDQYLEARKQFSSEEWLDLLIQSIGLNPEALGRRSKLLQMIRLIPYCERNYNLIELGPKGTGKSHIFSEFSPHGILISGGEVSAPKLFVENRTGKIGLVGYWDSVAFDEIAGKDKSVKKDLIDIMKNYMANKTFSRGIETLGAEASMTFLGNTKKSVAYMMKHTHFFVDLPDKYIDSAFLDRLHYYNPGWESSIIRADLFTDGYGFIVDYFAEILRSLRNQDFSHQYRKYFSLNSSISTRDRDGIQKTFSGLMKILFPHEECTKSEVEELLRFSMEGRKRVKDHIMRIDETFTPVTFGYSDNESDQEIEVKTLEETQYPSFFNRQNQDPTAETILDHSSSEQEETQTGGLEEGRPKAPIEEPLVSGKHLPITENTKGISYKKLFWPYLKSATEITIIDPYIRVFWQIKNMMEFAQMVHENTPAGEEVALKLITKSDEWKCEEQDDNLKKIQQTLEGSRVQFSYEYRDDEDIHARSITTDTGWKITLDRGLDLFQRYEVNPFSLANYSQEDRLCKASEITYLRTEQG